MATICGPDVYLVRALEKVELALRRTAADPDCFANVSLIMVADEIQKMIKEIFGDRTTD